MKAVIKNKKEIAKGIIEVDLEVSEKIDFEPGQFSYFELINPLYSDAKGNGRYFSLINFPKETGIISFATRITDSAFKRSLVEAPLGTEMNIGKFAGSFTLPENDLKEIVLIAGGIGIAPFISMLRYIKEEKIDYKIIFIYSNKDKESAAFLEELEDYAREKNSFKLVLTMTADNKWTGEKRFLDGQFIKDYVKDINLPIYFISGPPAMVQSLAGILNAAGVGSQNIKTDSLLGY
jgi:ferredoxin-NADP reductase